MKTILVGTDYTAAGNRAVRYAAEMAFQYKARLIVVHATQLMLVTEAPMELSYVLDKMEESDHKKMLLLENNLKRKYDMRLKITTEVQTGFVANIIENKSHQHHPDLIVMGMPQLDFFSQKIFGTAGFQIVSKIDVPVLLIPESGRFKPLKKVVLAADGLAIKSKKGLNFITDILSSNATSLSYLHIKDELYPGFLKPYWNKLHQTFGSLPSQVHEVSAISGKTAQIIHDWSKKHKADWVITVARERNIFWNLFHESVSKKLAYLSQIPVLIIHDK
jgi:nucleotide-binding universal stress UspA family protein